MSEGKHPDWKCHQRLHRPGEVGLAQAGSWREDFTTESTRMGSTGVASKQLTFGSTCWPAISVSAPS